MRSKSENNHKMKENRQRVKKQENCTQTAENKTGKTPDIRRIVDLKMKILSTFTHSSCYSKLVTFSFFLS